MSIIWCGGEDIDFPNGYWPPSKDVSVCRTAYARYGMKAGTSDDTQIRSKTFGPVTSCWLSFVGGDTNEAYNVIRFAGLGKSGTNYALYACLISGKARIDTWSGSSYSALSSLSTLSMPNQTATKFDLEVINYGPSSTVRLYVDTVLYCEYTGDCTVGGLTELDQVLIKGYDYTSYISEVIVSTTDTRFMALKTLAPNAAGDANEWDSGSYTDIDENTVDDNDFLETTGSGDNYQCNLTGMPTGSWNVKAVKTIARAVEYGTGLGLKVGIKTNSVVHLGGAHGLFSWGSHEKLYNTNPETASAFTTGEIDSLQAAIMTDSTTTTTTSTTT